MAVTNNFEKSTLVSDFSMVLEKTFNPHNDKSLRVPFYLTSSYRQRNEIPGVSMLMNPSTVTFNQPKRTTRKDTQGGTIHYHWTNKAGRNNDILQMSFQGQTGNIGVRFGAVNRGFTGLFSSMQNDDGSKKRGPISWINSLAEKNRSVASTDLAVVLSGDDYSVSGAARLTNFFNLYSLTREPMVDPYTRQPVQYFISYSSPLFANTFVTFIGHFDRVLEFTEDANDPFNVKYSFGFVDSASMPSMGSIYTTVSRNLSYTLLNPLG